MVNSKPADEGKDRSFRWWIEVVVVFLLFFVAAGDPVPDVNEAHYLCRLKHFWDPGWCHGDLFLESPDAHFTVVWFLGWLTLVVPLEVLAWIGRGLSWTLLAFAWTRLVSRVTPVFGMAALSAALLIYGVNVWHFAGEWVIGGFEAKSLAYGFVFLALADALEARWNRAWGLLGVASAFHALVGGWSVLALLAAWALSDRKVSFRSMLPGCVIGGVVSLAGVVPALLLNVGTSAETVDLANQTYVFLRLPHHLAPLTKGADWLTVRAWAHLPLVAILMVITIVRRRQAGPMLIARWALVAEAISLVGLLIELVGWSDPSWSASILKYYWFRLADIAAPVAVAILAVQWIGEGLRQKRQLAGLAAVVLAVVAGWHLQNLVAQRARQPVAPGHNTMREPLAWVEMCSWVASNTPKDAVFLVPRSSHTFKWHAGRAEVVTYKDVPQDAMSMVEWRRRYLDVFQVGEWPSGSRRWAPSLASLGATRLRELAHEFGAQYVLDQAPRRDLNMPLRRRASLPIVHRVGPYTLYEIN